MSTTKRTIHNAKVIYQADFWELVSKKNEGLFKDEMLRNMREIEETAHLIQLQLAINPELAIQNIYFVIALLYFYETCNADDMGYVSSLTERLQHFCKIKMEHKQ